MANEQDNTKAASHPLQDEPITILFRPTGEHELALIHASGDTAFPPRLSWQPIFYPVLNEEYARQIASQWNARDGKHGYVTRFAVRSAYLAQYEIHTVGAAIHQEYETPL